MLPCFDYEPWDLQAPECSAYWAVLVYRVALLPPEDLAYMLQFMDHNHDRDMEGVEEHVSLAQNTHLSSLLCQIALHSTKKGPSDDT